MIYFCEFSCIGFLIVAHSLSGLFITLLWVEMLLGCYKEIVFDKFNGWLGFSNVWVCCSGNKGGEP